MLNISKGNNEKEKDSFISQNQNIDIKIKN